MLPFSVDQFFSVFAAYNNAIWPLQVIAYLLGGVVVWAGLAAHPWAGRVVATVLGILWLWNGLAYHLAFFASINPAAYGFAALFVVQGLMFLGYGTVAGRLRFSGRMDWRGAVGTALIAYAAAIYSSLGYLLGHVWPAMPIFGVAPCPTTIFTFGVMMLATGPLPLWLVLLPVIWAGIGATAALLLNVPEDLGLLVSGLLGSVLLPFWGYGRTRRPWRPSRSSSSAPTP